MNANNQNQGHFKSGDLVIGSSDPSKSVYSATGVKLDQHGVSVFGNEADIKAQQKQFEDTAIRGGGKLIKTAASVKTRVNKKKNSRRNSEVIGSANLLFCDFEEEITHESSPTIRLETIIFENSFGKIKSKVSHVVDHPQAIMLIFANEDAVVFEPKVGEMLTLYRDSSFHPEQVYYPGVTFNSPDCPRKFMILFKVPEENQD